MQFWNETRQGYLKVYHSYRAQTPPPNPAICSDVTTKQFAQSLRTKWGHKVAQAAVVARAKESSA